MKREKHFLTALVVVFLAVFGALACLVIQEVLSDSDCTCEMVKNRECVP